jgi:hypothetical protein
VMLVRTPTPYPYESLFGFILRIAETNGYHSPSYLWELMGAKRWRSISLRVPIYRLAELLGQPSEGLGDIAYEDPKGRERGFKVLSHCLGNFLYQSPLRVHRPAFCVECTSHDGYLDAFWDLSIAVGCDRHNTLVVRKCSACGRKVDWRRSGLLNCRCGAKYEPPPETLPTALREIMGLIRAKLHNAARHTVVNTSKLPMDHLWAIPLRELLQLLETLGDFVGKARRNDERRNATSVERAASALSDWPHEYHRALSRIGDLLLKKHPHATGIRQQFEGFYEPMFKNSLFVKHSKFLKEEFLNFGHNVWGKGVIDRRMLRGSSATGPRRFVPLAQVLRQHHISDGVAEKLIAEGKIVTRKISARRGYRILVDLVDSDLPASSTGIIDERRAAAFLGLYMSVLKELRRRGILCGTARGSFQRSVHKDELEAFLQTFLAITPIASTTTLTLAQIMRLKFLSADTRADLVEDLLNGKLAVAGRKGDRLSDLLLEKDQVQVWLKGKKEEATSDSCTATECWKQTGLTVRSIPAAIKSGLLNGCEVKGRAVIRRTSIEQFNKRYEVLSDIAHSLHTSVPCLLRKCQGWRISVITLSASKGNGRVHVVRKRANVVTRWHSSVPKIRICKEPAYALFERKLRDYLQELKARGQRIPRQSNSKVNLEAIAKSCGGDASRFWKHGNVRAILGDADVEERQLIGLSEVDVLATLRLYLQNLRKGGLPIPIWSGRANRKAIAKACGISRHVFYREPAAVKSLDSFALGSGCI